MSHILSIKIPDNLLAKLNDASQKTCVSKGAIVRLALENYLKASTSLFDIEAVTQALRDGKTPKIKVNWNKIYEKTRSAKTKMTPEQEVLYHRRRGL